MDVSSCPRHPAVSFSMTQERPFCEWPAAPSHPAPWQLLGSCKKLMRWWRLEGFLYMLTILAPAETARYRVVARSFAESQGLSFRLCYFQACVLPEPHPDASCTSPVSVGWELKDTAKGDMVVSLSSHLIIRSTHSQ